jgi:antitoxin component YwqK of YwqJK toxin-antitoxin module
MKKHSNVPAAATWNATVNQWELGERNEQGKEIGIWEAWHIEGHHCSTTDYTDGTPPFLFRRFHPDGTLSNDKLLYEHIKSAGKPAQLPFIRYYYPNGNTLIDYTSHGDGSGTWHLYDEAGIEMLSMEEPDENEPNDFLSTNRGDKWDVNQADWERAIIYFKYRYEERPIC